MGYTEVGYGGVTVLAAAGGGGYPEGNSVLVRGRDSTLLVDPSIALLERPPSADVVLVSHAHEDHMAGLDRYPDAEVRAHDADVAAVRSRAVLLAAYGMPDGAAAAFEPTLVDEFRIDGRPDAVGVPDGHRVDLGDRTATLVHLPGHTPGHCGVLVEPDGFFFVADVDLTSFGPYYGDLGSDLRRFEASIERCAEVDARWFGTFHQKGVVEGAGEFRRRLRDYREVLVRREERMLAFLAEPRTVEDLVGHRFVYRAHVDEPYVDGVERRTAEQHLRRMVDTGVVAEVEPGRFRAAVG